MSYLVLARKYRPQSFDDLVGQEHVAKRWQAPSPANALPTPMSSPAHGAVAKPRPRGSWPGRSIA